MLPRHYSVSFRFAWSCYSEDYILFVEIKYLLEKEIVCNIVPVYESFSRGNQSSLFSSGT